MRIGDATAKGYYRAAFDDAFAAYAPSQNVTTSQPHCRNDFSDFQNVTPDLDVTFQKSQKAYGRSVCDVVTFEKHLQGNDEPFGAGEPDPGDWWRDTEPEDEGLAELD